MKYCYNWDNRRTEFGISGLLEFICGIAGLSIWIWKLLIIIEDDGKVKFFWNPA